MKSQIISASRRSDIPAFFGEWFMQQIKAGYCEVANPFNPKQVNRIQLSLAAVDCFVFWTKYPISLLPHLPKLQKMGYPFYFLFTLNAYDKTFENQLPPLPKRVEMFQKISSLVGSRRIIWRYDPIIISQQTDMDFHLRSFQKIAKSLKGYTNKVIISLYDEYAKTRKRLKNYKILKNVLELKDLPDFMQHLKQLAAENHIQAQSCCDRLPNIKQGSCIDGDLVEDISGRRISKAKDTGQRKNCLCAQSRDIGTYNTCRFACEYCYAIK
ncbi:MAG: hypothetical protein PWQ09_889 [Candidatus Cloacimonadota bacterium]|jgi:DNA repair photolyase|nr:hypothetical protein [Candidatus Cloacimonadota bacterium]